jgi:hypothetical protein
MRYIYLFIKKICFFFSFLFCQNKRSNDELIKRKHSEEILLFGIKNDALIVEQQQKQLIQDNNSNSNNNNRINKIDTSSSPINQVSI